MDDPDEQVTPMHLTRYSDYALRTLIHVALKAPEQSTVSEIACSYHISQSHLMKVVQQLSQAHYLNARRGRQGGLRLGKPAQAINLGQLLRLTEGSMPLVECLGADNACIITPACRLKQLLSAAQEAFFTHLEQYTLEDLLADQAATELRQFLRIE